MLVALGLADRNWTAAYRLLNRSRVAIAGASVAPHPPGHLLVPKKAKLKQSGTDETVRSRIDVHDRAKTFEENETGPLQLFGPVSWGWGRKNRGKEENSEHVLCRQSSGRLGDG